MDFSDITNEMFTREKIPKLIFLFFIFDFLCVFLYLLNIGMDQPSNFITKLVDISGERNFPTWYSSIKLFSIGIVFAIFAHQRFDRKDDSSWLLMVFPFVFLFLSFDEFVGIHEWLGHKSDVLLPGGNRRNTLFPETGVWMFLVGIPFILFMIGPVFRLERFVNNNSFKKFLLGFVIFVGSSIGIEVISNFTHGLYSLLQACFEEGGEMVGATIILWSAYDFDILLNFKNG